MPTQTIEVLRIPGTLFPRGAFDENASYKFLNFVESGGNGYVCLQPCTGIPVTNTAYWFKFVFKGDKGDAFTYADLTAEQKAELVRDATAAAQAAASSAQSAADDAAAALQKFNTIKAAIDAIDPQSTEGSIQTLAAKQGLLEADLNALGPKIGEPIVIPITESSKYIALNVGVGNAVSLTPASSSLGYCYRLFNVSAGDTLIVNGTGGATPRLWGFIDVNNALISVASENATATNLKVVAPDNAAKAIINDNSGATSYVIRNGKVVVRVDEIVNDFTTGGVAVPASAETVKVLDQKIDGEYEDQETEISSTFASDNAWNFADKNVGDSYTTASPTTVSGAKAFLKTVHSGERYVIRGYANSNYQGLYLITDSTNVVTRRRFSHTRDQGDVEITIASGEEGGKIRVNLMNYDSSTDGFYKIERVKTVNGLRDDIESVEGRVQSLETNDETQDENISSLKSDVKAICIKKQDIEYGLKAGYVFDKISGPTYTVTDIEEGVRVTKTDRTGGTIRFRLTSVTEAGSYLCTVESNKSFGSDVVYIYIGGSLIETKTTSGSRAEFSYEYDGNGSFAIGFQYPYNVMSQDFVISIKRTDVSGAIVLADNLSERIKALEGKVRRTDILDFVTPPSTIYGAKYKNGGFNLLNRLYIEGVINKSTSESLSLNGEQSVYAEEDNPTVVGDKSISVKVGGQNFEESTITVPIKRVDPSSLVGGNFKIMHVGDSLTDNGVGCCSNFLLKCFKADYGNFNHVFVGTKSSGDGSSGHIKIGTYEYDCKVFDEGMSGWSIADYLRKIFHIYPVGKDVSTKIAWDALGLATKTRDGVQGRPTRVDLSVNSYATSEQIVELRQTCHGYYDADPSAELWEWIVNTMHITSFVYGGVTYTFGASYSSADDAAQKAAIKYMCSDSFDHPTKNKFYDYDTVQSSNGEYAFNLGAYLSKYKTLDDDGVTRLVVGETAGSKVSNVNSHDLCTPTHICLVMSQNEYIRPDLIVDDLIKFADLATGYDNSIKVIIGVNRPYGFKNRDFYATVGCYKKFSFDYIRYTCNNLLKTAIADTDYSMIDLYAIQNPSGTYGQSAFDLFDLGERIVDMSDSVHAGSNVIGYMERAYQFVCCIISQIV